MSSVGSAASSCPACGAPLDPRPALRGVDRLHGTPGEFEVRVCPSCGTGRTFPLVGPDELGSLYPAAYNAYSFPAGRLARLLATALYRWHYRRLLRHAPLDVLRRRPPGRLLDVGAGRGDLAAILSEAGWRVTGLEPSAEACDEGRRRGLHMVQGTLADAKLEQDFDAVVFQHSLEHVVEPAEDLGRARELLRPGGSIFVLVPNFGSWQSRRFGDAWFHLDLPRHRSHFTVAGLERLLRTAGFEQVRLSTATTPDGLPNSLQYRRYGRRLFRSGPTLYLTVGLSIVLRPAFALLDRVRGGGDELGASAARSDGG
ncbi:MAG TPA: methyltransferase domain-containing protein [Gaiellaceae bacterium]|nr:methyltransferase domain-containing protein [Gaiellaceae bacterium]